MIEKFLIKDGDIHQVDIFGASDEELEEISREMGLALSLDEMRLIREYFKRRQRNPTDLELQALGQAWSEHCCYKSSKVVLKENIYGIEEQKVGGGDRHRRYRQGRTLHGCTAHSTGRPAVLRHA